MCMVWARRISQEYFAQVSIVGIIVNDFKAHTFAQINIPFGLFWNFHNYKTCLDVLMKKTFPVGPVDEVI